jgi:hypothetical protein
MNYLLIGNRSDENIDYYTPMGESEVTSIGRKECEIF